MNTIKFQKGSTLTVAHRGVSGLETENTAAAFVAAGNRSYYGIETDMRKTADGRFVILHDDDLVRVAGEKIVPEEVTLSLLSEIVLFDKDGTKSRKDLRLPTLEDYIKICKKYEKHCVLELKSEFTEEDTARYVEIIKSLDYLDSVTFISFKYSNLVHLRRLLPGQSIQYLFSEMSDERIEKLLAEHFDADINYKALTEENIAALHEKGIKVNCWTVDNPEIAERLVGWGVDYITTNILE